MENKVRVLLVEDDEELSSLISEYLSENGLEVSLVADGDRAEAAIRATAPDLVILDLMLPGKDGLQICRDVKTWYEGPVLMLTARTGWVDEIVGLEMGADDYLGKPVEPRLLLARVRTLLRRGWRGRKLENEASTKLVVNRECREARLGGRLLELTDAEFELLAYLKEHPGEALSRSQLSEDVFETAYDGLGRSIDVRIGRLRTKIGDDGKHPRWIKSIRGVGYLFAEPE